MARNILVVEDDNNISNLIKMYLDKEGFDVRIAADGGKAVEEFKEMKMCQWLLREPVWWHFAPQTTMPSSRRSTTWTYISGSAWSWGALERSPLGSVMAPSTVRSLSWT